MAKAKEGIVSVVTQKNRRENNFDWNKMLVAIWGIFWSIFTVYFTVFLFLNSYQNHQRCLVSLVKASKEDNNRKHFSLATFDRKKGKLQMTKCKYKRIKETTCSREGNRMNCQKNLT